MIYQKTSRLLLGLSAILLLQACVGLPTRHPNALDFGGERDVQLGDGAKAEFYIDKHAWFDPKDPFYLNIRLIDPERRYAAATITKLVLEYEGGEVQQIADPWVRDLADLDLSLKYISVHALRVDHRNVKVICEGYFTAKDGQKSVFSWNKKFKARTGRRTTWIEMGF